MAESTTKVRVECGYCLYENEQLQDPRVLPCTHVYCRGCLAGYHSGYIVVYL